MEDQKTEKGSRKEIETEPEDDSVKVHRRKTKKIQANQLLGQKSVTTTK